MNRWIAASFAVVLAFAVVLPVAAKTEKAAAGKPAAAAGQTSVTGPVKGAVTGKTFVIARKGGEVTVDASKAKVREAGKFVKFDVIKGGTMVMAKGTLAGTKLNATDVTVFPSKKPLKMTPTSVAPTKAPAPGK